MHTVADTLPVLTTIPPLRDATVVKRLTEGPLADKWLLEAAGSRVVLRVDRPEAQILGIDRRGEIAALYALEKAGRGAAPVWVDSEAGILAVHWFPGDAWTDSDLRATDNLRRLAELLQQLHSLSAATVAALPEFGLTQRLHRYAAVIGTEDAMQCAAAVGRDISALLSSSAGECFCHNDPVAGNIVAGEELRFIDYEYAGRGDPLFDLAAVIEHHALHAEQIAALTSAYRAAGGVCEPRQLERWREIYRVTERLWAAAVRSV